MKQKTCTRFLRCKNNLTCRHSSWNWSLLQTKQTQISIFNANFPGTTPDRFKNVIPFVTIYYHNIDNKSLMQTVKNKFENIRNEHLQSIYKATNFILSLKQRKEIVQRTGAFYRFTSSFKNIREPATYKCSDKRCTICQNYLNETNKFTMSNRQVLETRREIDCYSVNVINYL